MSTAIEKNTQIELSELGIVRVKGDDASEFLQGQLSNDIQLLNEEHAHQLSAYCNPKGRMLALFHIIKENDTYLLIAPRAVLDKVIPRLKMFVMRAAVEINQPDDLFLYGLIAGGTPALPAAITGFSIIRHEHDQQRYFLLSHQATEETMESADLWNERDIRQNIPQLYIENHEALIPQTANLDLVGGINFKKGCYPGQEIIARVKYRGKPKSRMIAVEYGDEFAMEIGASVYIDNKDAAAGTVINRVDTGSSTLLSISIPVTHIDQGAIYLDENKSNQIKRLPAAYEIPV